MTPAQVRDARKLLKWSIVRLASNSGTQANVVRDFEIRGLLPVQRSARSPADPLPAIRATLEAAGVEFTAGGVRLRGVGE